MNKNQKPTRGRPVKPVNFNFGIGRPFTIEQVVKRCKGKISKPGVYNKLMGPKGLVTKRKATVLKQYAKTKGKGHPTYLFILNVNKAKKAKTVKAVAPAAE